MRLFAPLLLLLATAPAAHAAQSYDGCAGFIDSVPATITAQGTWCLRRDLSTAMTSGAAITIAGNNVTIDCNGFKIGGLAAGPDTQAAGVLASNRLNATVRACAIRGFRFGVSLVGSGGGHLVEDNRIDLSMKYGIQVEGDGNLVQRNRIFDTGSLEAVENGGGTGILADADIRDNTINRVIGAFSWGIVARADGTEVRRNRVRHLMGGMSAWGITLTGLEQSAVDNIVFGREDGGSPGEGLRGSFNGSFCRDNRIAQMSIGMIGCEDNGGNVVH